MGILDALTVPVVLHTDDAAVAAAASEAGALGVLTTEHLGPDRFADGLAAARRATARPLGACVYAGGGEGADPERYAALALRWAAHPVRLGEPHFGDDAVTEEVASLVRDPLRVVEFAAGLVSRETVEALRRAGSEVWSLADSADEARVAAACGIDAVVVQGADVPGLVQEVRGVVDLPVIAAGPIETGHDLAAALAAGAVAVHLQARGPDPVAAAVRQAADARTALEAAVRRLAPPTPTPTPEEHPL
jgi:nitronate monooxygenase